MKPLLEIKNLKTYFDTDDGLMPSVDGVSLDLSPGETLGVVGESGCGKTVLSLSVMRLIPSPGRVEAGEIIFGEKDLLKIRTGEMQKIRGKEIAMIFQDPLTSLNPVFNIDEQMTGPLMVHKKLSRKEARGIAVDMLEKVGVAAAGKRIFEYPHQFSGGQRQRISIATALSLQPKILIADEPTTALDVSIQAQILELLKNLQAEFGTAMIFISHNLGVIAGICRRVAVMYAGWVVEEAPAEELFGNPLHPYTRALIKAIPSVHESSRRLTGLPGQPPCAGEMITGCKLHPRCPDRIQGRCDVENPEFIDKNGSHRVRCFLYS